jgi:hypothetical protein
MRSLSCGLLPAEVTTCERTRQRIGNGKEKRLVSELYSNSRVGMDILFLVLGYLALEWWIGGHVPGEESLSAYFLSSVSTSLPFSL